MGKNIERQVRARLNATGVESLAKGYELHSVNRGAIFFLPVQSWVMMRTGWCFNNINMAIKHVGLEGRKQVRGYCHAPYERY